MKTIDLPCGKQAMVSDCDWERVRRLRWYDHGNGYVRARNSKKLGGDGAIYYLHRFVMEAAPGVVVDHIDRNPLNNSRENLQLMTQARNCMRSIAAKAGGVTYQRGRAKAWRARLKVDGAVQELGAFYSPEEAWQAVETARADAWRDSGAVF